MQDTLKPGIEYVHKFTIPSTKTVPALYPESVEFLAMPEVFATGYMIGLIEWTCIKAINSLYRLYLGSLVGTWQLSLETAFVLTCVSSFLRTISLHSFLIGYRLLYSFFLCNGKGLVFCF